MAKKNQTTEAQPNKKSRPKVETPTLADQTPEFAGDFELIGGLTAAAGNGDSVENQMAARLSDPRIPLVQRQALAGQIGQLQGNRHLQRLVNPASGLRSLTGPRLSSERLESLVSPASGLRSLT